MSVEPWRAGDQVLLQLQGAESEYTALSITDSALLDFVASFVNTDKTIAAIGEYSGHDKGHYLRVFTVQTLTDNIL